MSQPALSHQIAAIERELGTPVVERLARGIRPTAAGLAVVEEARVAIEAADRAISVGKVAGEGRGGRIRILCLESLIAWLLVPVLRQWRRQRPDVLLDIFEHTYTDRMASAVEAGTVDIAVCLRPTQTTAHLEVLGRMEMVVVSSLEHRFSRRKSVPPSELTDEPFVHYTEDNGMSVWIDQVAARYNVILNPVLRTRSPRTAAQLAAAGMGVTIAPYSALTPLSGGAIRSLDPVMARDVVVIVGSPHDALVRRFVADILRRGLPNSMVSQD
jgi:DNA-binding transcriptional LysR family regulator